MRGSTNTRAYLDVRATPDESLRERFHDALSRLYAIEAQLDCDGPSKIPSAIDELRSEVESALAETQEADHARDRAELRLEEHLQERANESQKHADETLREKCA